MAWGRFIVALTGVFLLHTSVLPLLGPDWLDLMLMLALIYGLTAPALDARLAGWIIGLARDVDSAGPLGLHALVFGLALVALTQMRESVNRELWWVRALTAFVVAWPAELLLLLYARIFEQSSASWAHIAGRSLTVAAVAALLAGLVIGLPRVRGGRRARRRSVARW